MKKWIIFISILLFILMIMLCASCEEKVNNFEYKKENIEIYYPYFNNKIIDDYINDYLNVRVEEASYNFDNKYNLYIDYDYDEVGDNILLTFFELVYDDRLETTKTKSFNINLKKNNIKQSNKNLSEYDIYHNKVVNKNKKMVAFTFDDGPNHNTVKIINTLKKYNSSATFFVLGNRLKAGEEIVEMMQEYNMEIGNHTYSHRLLTNASSDDITKEVKKTNELIFSITNTYPRLVRPSYGSFNNKIRKSINMPIIIWNIDTLDWKYHNSKRIANKILSKVSDGDIILMHDIYSSTANAVEIVVPKLIEKGYQIVSVSELFYYKNIELKNGKVYGNAR